MSTHSSLMAATLAVLGTLASGSVAAADSTPSGDDQTCGKILSPAVAAAWTATAGRAGRLGCPIESEGDTATSARGSAARAARFEGGEIIRHMSGPFAGQAFAVAACDRLYVQFGGPSGWLGLPTSDAINTPDGQRQRFEGGTLTFTRALGTCDAEHS